MIFNQLEFLPVAYFLIVMSVVCATVLGKILGGLLLESTSGSLRKILSRNLPIAVTGDRITFHLMERRLLYDLNTRILFALMGRCTGWLTAEALVPVPVECLPFRQNRYPEKYWSGCPPNGARSGFYCR